jgi:hypothetical protein
MVFQNDILAGAAGAGGGYEIDQSIRFNDGDSAYLSRTPGSAESDLTRTTVSVWYKRGVLGTSQTIFSAGTSGEATWFGFTSADVLGFFQVASSTTVASITTTALFRDPSAWYHIVFTYDSNEAASADRITITVNGVEQAVSTAVAVDSARALDWNSTDAHSIGRRQDAASEYCDGYMAEFVNIPATALAATSFGETNDDGVWVPKEYTGSYGTNGFYITGEDSADLGADYSGNSNDFTSSGLTSDDQRGDTPTLNYPTMSPISVWDGANAILSEGNLRTENNASTTYFGNTLTMQPPKSGKWYFEASIVTAGQFSFGIEATNKDFWSSGSPGQTATGYALLSNGAGTRATRNNNTNTNTRSADTAGDVFQIAMDCDTGELWLGRENTWYGGGDPSAGTTPTYTFDAALEYAIVLTSGTNGNGSIRYVQGPDWTYTAPTNFKELNTDNLPAPTIKDGTAHFQSTLYTGNGTAIGSGGLAVSQSENSTFQPDLVWIKERNGAADHALYDAVRGTTKDLASNNSNAETTETEGLTAFDAAGFTVGNLAKVNTSSDTYVAWQWLAANSTASNSDGSIASTVSANTTSGFSIVTYTGDGNDNATVGHGLGVTPKTVWLLPRSNGDNKQVSNWETGVTAFTEDLKLNVAEAANSSSTRVKGGSSTTFTLGTDVNVNGSGRTYLAYCFNEIEGFSKFGTYTGNGSSDGAFVYCGFRPALVILRRTNAAENWVMVDSARNEYNVANLRLYADTTNADITSTTHDFLSNGFKLRASDGGVNASGNPYVFMAFAEHPFGGDGVAPVPAR